MKASDAVELFDLYSLLPGYGGSPRFSCYIALMDMPSI